MDPIDNEALSRLSSTLGSLLSGVGAGLPPRLHVHPRRFLAAGIGGLVGLSSDPAGEIVGRRLEAAALVEVRAATMDALPGAISAVTRALTTDRPALRSQGILRLELEEIGPKPTAQMSGVAEREVRFKVLYELVKNPTVAGGVIREVPLDLELARSRPPRPLLRLDPAAGSLSLFEVFDDPQAMGGASQWQVDAAERRIEQRSAISGGSQAMNANKPGTYLVLRTSPSRPAVPDLQLRVQLQSGGPGGLGLVFRWLDVNNFYFFLLHTDNQSKYRILGKKVGGQFQAMETPALDSVQGHEPGRVYDVRLAAEGPAFAVYLDGQQILEGRDSSLPGPGRLGLMSRNNKQAFFYRVRAEQL